jgi:hypothetical protein
VAGPIFIEDSLGLAEPHDHRLPSLGDYGEGKEDEPQDDGRGNGDDPWVTAHCVHHWT